MNIKAEHVSETDNDCRTGMNPIPDNINTILSKAQKQALERLEGLGWTLKFVRRVGLSKPIVVLSDPLDRNLGVLDENGHLEEKPKLQTRKDRRGTYPDDKPSESPPDSVGGTPGETTSAGQLPSPDPRNEMALVRIQDDQNGTAHQ